jgi:hypothetical protein
MRHPSLPGAGPVLTGKGKNAEHRSIGAAVGTWMEALPRAPIFLGKPETIASDGNEEGRKF